MAEILNAGRVLPALSPSPPGVVTPAIAPQIARTLSAPPALAPPYVAPPALAPPYVAPPALAPGVVTPTARTGRVLPALSPSPPGVVTPAIAPQIARSRSAPPALAPPDVAPPALAPPDVAPPALAPPDVAPPQVVGIHNLTLVRQRIAAEKAKKHEGKPNAELPSSSKKEIALRELKMNVVKKKEHSDLNRRSRTLH